MNPLVFILFFTGTAYIVFLAWCLWSWHRMPVEAIEGTSHEPVTVVVPARNEAKVIVRCLESLATQDYPNLEVIVADDDSSDGTGKLAEEFFRDHTQINGKVIRLSGLQNENGPYKKRAICRAIEAAHGSWIITTDADCTASPQWISSLMDFAVRKNAVFVAGPVVMHEEKTILQKMQSLEFTGLVGLGAASLSRGVPMMCNGANIAYSKEAFHVCGGYSGDTLASGDDTALLYAMHQHFPGKVEILKSTSALVKTLPQHSAKGILEQRIRWSSKIPVATAFTRVVAAAAFFFHAFILVGIFIPAVREYALLSWLFKSLVELEFLKRVTAFFHQRALLLWFANAQIFYPLYVVLTGLLAMRGEYSWKGRKQVLN